jgi:RNA polymerase sigma-70 factor, ECF subfamily
MRWSIRSTRQAADFPPDGEATLRPPGGFGGDGQSGSSSQGLSGQESEAAAGSRSSAGGSSGSKAAGAGLAGPKSGSQPHFPGMNSRPETVLRAQPSAAGGVPEDMATLVLNSPAIGLTPAHSPRTAQGTGPHGDRGADSAVTGTWEAGQAAADPASDAAIMLRVAAGDEEAFNYLAQKYHRAMIHFLFRMVHNQAVAEELAQEVFLRVYRSRESYRAEAKFTTWLYRIATNLAVNHARDTRHERSAQTVYLDAPDEESGTTPDVADDEPSVEQKLVRDERMAAIRRHVMALPERQRMAVLMHKYQGMDYRQIGEVLKLSESATKSLLFRAYQTLRDRLKEFV